MDTGVFDMIILAMGLYEVVMGITGLIRGEIAQGLPKLQERYTDESLKRGAKPYSWGLLIVGVAVLVLEVGLVGQYLKIPFFQDLPEIPLWIASAVLMAGGFAVLIVTTRKFVEKSSYGRHL